MNEALTVTQVRCWTPGEEATRALYSVPQNAAAGPEGGQHVLVLLTSDSLTKADGVMQVEVQKRSVCSDPLAKLNGSHEHMSRMSGGSFISSVLHSSSQLHIVNSSNSGGWSSWKSSLKNKSDLFGMRSHRFRCSVCTGPVRGAATVTCNNVLIMQIRPLRCGI